MHMMASFAWLRSASLGSSGICWVSLDVCFTGVDGIYGIVWLRWVYWFLVSLGDNGTHLLGAAWLHVVFHWVLLGFTRCCLALSGSTRCLVRCSLVLLGFAGFP